MIIAALIAGGCGSGRDPVEPLFTPGDTTSVVIGNLRYSARTETITPPATRTTLTITNLANATATVELSACGLRTLAFENPERSGDTIWDSSKNRPPCRAVSYVYEIEPGRFVHHAEDYLANVPYRGRRLFLLTVVRLPGEPRVNSGIIGP